jgi:DNA-binding GntR family transcriptional regulator
MGRYRGPSARLRGSVEQSIAEHQAIVDAARARDAERAVAMLMRHIEVPQRTIENLTDEEFARSAGLAPVVQ